MYIYFISNKLHDGALRSTWLSLKRTVGGWLSMPSFIILLGSLSSQKTAAITPLPPLHSLLCTFAPCSVANSQSKWVPSFFFFLFRVSVARMKGFSAGSGGGDGRSLPWLIQILSGHLRRSRQHKHRGPSGDDAGVCRARPPSAPRGNRGKTQAYSARWSVASQRRTAAPRGIELGEQRVGRVAEGIGTGDVTTEEA